MRFHYEPGRRHQISVISLVSPLLLVIACVLLSAVLAYNPSVVNFALNSDQLTIPSFYWDLSHGGMQQLHTWQLSRAPYIFPDLLVYFGIAPLVQDPKAAIFATAVLIFLAWICVAGSTIAKITRLPLVPCAALILIGEATDAFILAGSPYEALLFFRYAFATHFSAFLISLATLNIFSDVVACASKRVIAKRILAALLIFLATVSDQIFLVYYAAPIGITIFYAAATRQVSVGRAALLLAEQGIPAIVATFGARGVLELLVRLQPVPTYDVWSLPGKLVFMLGTIPWTHPVTLIAFWLPLLFAFIYGAAALCGTQRLPAVAPGWLSERLPHSLGLQAGEDRKKLIVVFLLSSIVMTLLAVGPLYPDLTGVRYLIPVLEAPLLLIALALAPVLPPLIRSLASPIATGMLVLAYSRVAFSGGDIKPLLISPNQDSAAALEACAREHHLTAGLANYWISRRMMVLLNWKLPINQLQPTAPALFYWGNNFSWFLQAVNSPDRSTPPLYNFIILNGLKDADVISSFGNWSETLSCGEFRIAKYDPPDQLRSTVAFMAERIRGQFASHVLQPHQSIVIPMSAFFSLLTKYDGSGWQVDGTEGKPGYLLYGPYWKIKRGTYSATVSISAEGLAEGSRIEMTEGADGRVVAAQQIDGDLSGHREDQITVKGSFGSDVSDFQLRVFYGGRGKLRITKVTLERE